MKKSVLACGILVACASFAVEPEVNYSAVNIKGTCTPEEAAAARAKFDAVKSNKPDWARVTVREGDDATVAALAAAFPECTQFKIDKSKITTLAPLATLKAKTLEIYYCDIADLSPIGDSATVETVNLYGSTVKDFSPLAKCPKLKEINYYATKATPEAYQTLGTLKQCKTFKGGLSDITSLEWVKEVPQIETLEVFAELVSDFSPVSTAKNLKKFRGWNMDGKKLGGKGDVPALGDVSFLAACEKLETLELPGSKYSNLAALAGLKNLKSVVLSGAKCDVDLSFVKGMPKLNTINASNCSGNVSGFGALAGLPALKYCDLSENAEVDVAFAKNCPVLSSLRVYGTTKRIAKISGFDGVSGAEKLETLDIQKTEGCTLAAIKPSAKLNAVTVSKGQFPDDQVKALEDAMKAANKRARLNVR